MSRSTATNTPLRPVPVLRGREREEEDIIAACMSMNFNPLDAMGICLNKHKLMYKVLAPSIITPYGLTEALDTLILWVRGG